MCVLHRFLCHLRVMKRLFKMFRNIASVDKDVQSMLLPLNVMQYIMFCPKYRIKDNIITPNSFISNLVSIIVTLMFILAFVHCTCVTITNYIILEYSYIMPCAAGFFFCFGFVINCVSNIIQTKNNVQFVLTFQKVHRFVNSDNSFKKIILWNWIMVVEVLGLYLIVHSYFYTKSGTPFMSVYAVYFLIFFDFNIVYAMRVIHVLKNKIELWNIRDFNFKESDAEFDKVYCTRVFKTFVEILDCYDNFKYSFQQCILYYLIKVFLFSLVCVKSIIDVSKMGVTINNMDKTAWTMGVILVSLLNNLMWQAMLIKQSEKFYSAIQSVHDTCTFILKSPYSEHEKNLCKNVLRLHRASFNKIRVCGLFYVDAALQLNLMWLITDYTVTFLQFAFL